VLEQGQYAEQAELVRRTYPSKKKGTSFQNQEKSAQKLANQKKQV